MYVYGAYMTWLFLLFFFRLEKSLLPLTHILSPKVGNRLRTQWQQGLVLEVTNQMMKNQGNLLVQDLEQRSMTSPQEETMR